MGRLPDDILKKIALELDYDDLIRYCQANKEFSMICGNENFWIDKIYHDFNTLIQLDIGDKLQKIYVKPGTQKYYPSSRSRAHPISSRDFYQLIFTSNNTFITEDDLNKYLIKASRVDNNAEIIKLLVNKGATNLDSALVEAVDASCASNVELLINLGATNLINALYVGVLAGRKKILKLLIDKGGINYKNVLLSALEKNEYKIVSFLLKYNLVTTEDLIQLSEEDDIDRLIDFIDQSKYVNINDAINAAIKFNKQYILLALNELLITI